MRKKVILFLISQSITLFGSTLVQMAVVWYATLLTSSGLWVAAFSVCSYLPQFLVSFWGGVWADRFPGKLLIEVQQVLHPLLHGELAVLLLAVPAHRLLRISAHEGPLLPKAHALSTERTVSCHG